MIALAGLLAMTACGLPGDLTRPEPLFGTPEDRPDAELPSRRVESGLDTIRTGDDGDPRASQDDPFDADADADNDADADADETEGAADGTE